MNLSVRIERLIPDLFATVLRFPVAACAAAALCIYVNVYVVGHSSSADNWQVVLAGIAVFIAGGAGHLIAEGRGSRMPIRAVLLGAAAGGLIYFNRFFHSSELFLFGGLVPMLMISPFLAGGVKQGAVWLFNLRLGLAIILALIVGLVFGGSLSAVIAGLDFLLGIKLSNNIYERAWLLAMTLVGPVYGLSLVPRNLTDEVDLSAHQGSLMERGVSVLVNYVMVPMVLIYALILHAYAIKILAIGELPKGQIGTIVSLFAFGGTATWLLGWPWRETGTKLLRWFMQGWFWLLPVPAILLSLAIWRRVTDYGVTPDRYGIALVAVWTALVFVYLVLRRNRADMRVILGAAAALFLVGSFGPQGANSTTGVSQFARLKSFLESKGVLKDGLVVPSVPKMNEPDFVTVNSIVYSLAEVSQLDRLYGWLDKQRLSDKQLNESRYSAAYLLSNVLTGRDKPDQTVTANLSPKMNDNFYFVAKKPVDRSWGTKSRFIGPLDLLGNNFPTGVAVRFASKKMFLTIDQVERSVDLEPLLKSLKLEANANSDQSKIYPMIAELDSYTSIIINQASGHIGDSPSLTGMNFWVVLHD
jgi:Domain of unknown function (DUF4153)